MKEWLVLFSLLSVASGFAATTNTKDTYETDTIKTTAGDLKITFFGHASLLFAFQGKMIYVDPFSSVADYTTLPKADIILITHEHQDHLDPTALQALRTPQTTLILTEAAEKIVHSGTIMKNGSVKTILGVKVTAVPAYNMLHKRPDGQPYHPKGTGNGYVITFGDKQLYVAGDSENIPEMKNLKNIDIAFLPVNLPYTMTPEMVVAAAKSFKPKILYPYHTGDTDTARIVTLMKEVPEIQVRIRKMK